MATATTYPTARQMIEQYDHLSNRELAALWLERLEVKPEPAKLLLPILTDEFRRLHRETARDLEKRVLKTEHRQGGVPVDRDAKKRLLHARMYIDVGRAVTVADATIEDWQLRKEYLRRMIASLQHSIERCDVAIGLLQYHNVQTLADVPEVEIPDDLGL